MDADAVATIKATICPQSDGEIAGSGLNPITVEHYAEQLDFMLAQEDQTVHARWLDPAATWGQQLWALLRNEFKDRPDGPGNLEGKECPV